MSFKKENAKAYYETAARSFQPRLFAFPNDPVTRFCLPETVSLLRRLSFVGSVSPSFWFSAEQNNLLVSFLRFWRLLQVLICPLKATHFEMSSAQTIAVSECTQWARGNCHGKGKAEKRKRESGGWPKKTFGFCRNLSALPRRWALGKLADKFISYTVDLRLTGSVLQTAHQST